MWGTKNYLYIENYENLPFTIIINTFKNIIGKPSISLANAAAGGERRADARQVGARGVPGAGRAGGHAVAGAGAARAPAAAARAPRAARARALRLRPRGRRLHPVPRAGSVHHPARSLETDLTHWIDLPDLTRFIDMPDLTRFIDLPDLTHFID